MTATAEESALWCSFCTKSSAEVERLIAGPGVYICDECVGACNAILERSRALPADTPPRLPEWKDMTDEQVVRHVPRIAATGQQVERSLKAWVGELRARGVTWARIGEALGMTRQSAWERFSGEE